MMSFFCLSLMAQNDQGTIVFTEEVSLDIDLGEHGAAFQGKLPSSRQFERLFYFDGQQTLYKDAEQKQLEEGGSWNMNEGGRVLKVEIKRPEYEVYQDRKKGMYVELKEFLGKKFLVADDLEKVAWKLGTEQKDILGYTCTKATYQDTSRTLEAWFTPQIPVSGGPQLYGQLPGMILELNLNDGERTYVATSIELGTPEVAVKQPKGGKKVTRAEFEEIQDQKLKEMDAERGSGGTIQIIRRN